MSHNQLGDVKWPTLVNQTKHNKQHKL